MPTFPIRALRECRDLYAERPDSPTMGDCGDCDIDCGDCNCDGCCNNNREDSCGNPCEGGCSGCARGCDSGGGRVCDCCVSVIESQTDATRCLANTFWAFASPLAFPCVFLFPNEWRCAANPGGDGPNPWSVTMLAAPCAGPKYCCECCFAYVCCPCAQFRLRHQVLGGDTSKYKCCQGHFDGEYCCAAFPCLNKNPQPKTAPCPCCSWYAGTHGDEGSVVCMALESCFCCPCAFCGSRQHMREEHELQYDPTEIRVCNCLEFFDCLSDCLYCCACGCYCGGCLAGALCGNVDGADECARSSKEAAEACMKLVHIIRDGMKHVMWISIACLTTQMVHHMDQHRKTGGDEALIPTGKSKCYSHPNKVQVVPATSEAAPPVTVQPHRSRSVSEV